MRNVPSKLLTWQVKFPFKICKKLTQKLLDFFYPPFCLKCRQVSLPESPYLCFRCWHHLAPPNPRHRCRHCFCELEAPIELCIRCRREPLLHVPTAYTFSETSLPLLLFKQTKDIATLAPFLAYQWSRLSWPCPNYILALPPEKPDRRVLRLAKTFASLLERPYLFPFRLHYERSFTRTYTLQQDLSYASLLFIDLQSSLEWRRHILGTVRAREIFLLALFPPP